MKGSFRLNSNLALALAYKFQSKRQFNVGGLDMTVALCLGRQSHMDDGVAINGKVMLYE